MYWVEVRGFCEDKEFVVREMTKRVPSFRREESLGLWVEFSGGDGRKLDHRK